MVGNNRTLLKYTQSIGIKSLSGTLPKDYALLQNYLIPFNPSTNIRFDIPKSSYIKIIIYNELGKEVTTLVNEKLNAGRYEVSWEGSNCSSGVYFYRLVADEYVNVKKMLMVK